MHSFAAQSRDGYNWTKKNVRLKFKCRLQRWSLHIFRPEPSKPVLTSIFLSLSCFFLITIFIVGAWWCLSSLESWMLRLFFCFCCSAPLIWKSIKSLCSMNIRDVVYFTLCRLECTMISSSHSFFSVPHSFYYFTRLLIRFHARWMPQFT